ncbi:MAG: hypothetical protein HW407_612 [Bacteroidetes bacterium]|nr:hypothetical protein [Bacteroidota bacterium]
MKKSATIFAVLMMVSGIAFAQNIQKGDFAASISSDGWSLAQGTGDRAHIEFITFEKPFADIPKVVVSLTGYEATPGADGSVRVHIAPEKVTKLGCVIKVKTWGDSKVNAAWGSYMAFGK